MVIFRGNMGYPLKMDFKPMRCFARGACFLWCLLALSALGCSRQMGGMAAEPCTDATDCAPGERCEAQRCVSGDSDAPGNGEQPVTPPGGDCQPACRGSERCRFNTCVPDLGTCTESEECQGDSYCSGDGECLPYGVPPEVTFDPACQRREVVEEVIPEVQCEWEGPTEAGVEEELESKRIYTAPLVADLNLDEDPNRLRPSIITTTFYNGPNSGLRQWRVGMLRVFDGRTCEEQFNFGSAAEEEFNTPGYGTQWAVVDLDDDVGQGGRPEIVGMRRAEISVNNNQHPPLNLYAIKVDVVDGEPRPRRLWLGRDCETHQVINFATNQANYGPGAFDIDDDGRPELLVGTMVFDHNGCLLNEPDDDDLGPVYVTHGPMYTVADVDGDGKVELVTGTRIAEWDSAARKWVREEYFRPEETLLTGHVALVDVGQYSTLPGMPVPNTLPEVVVVSAQNFSAGTESTGTIRVQTLDGRIVFGPRPLYFDSSAYDYAGKGGPPTASDFDGDGQVEFAAAAGEYYAVYDPDCLAAEGESLPERPGGRCMRSAAMAALPGNEGVLWAQPSEDRSSNATGSSVFDFNGDGRAEVVYSDECFTRVYDGATGEVIFSGSGSSGTGYEYPVIADVDGDFATEIVVARTSVPDEDCPDFDPIFGDGETSPFSNKDGFVVLRDPEDRWAASRSIWNQHAYSVTHVTDDGRVVRTRDWQQNWLNPDLNNFRQNVQGNTGLLAIADLTVAFFAIAEICGANLPAELALTARVCNRGTNGVGDGVLVHFAEEETVVCETETTRLLQPGECEEVACTGTVTNASTLNVRVDPNEEVADCRPGNDSGVPPTRLCLL